MTPGSPTAAFQRTRNELDGIRDACRRDQSRNGYFAAMYGRVTAAVEQRSEDGRFDDAARMATFVAAFAARYTRAFRARAAGRPTTQAWALAFDAAEQPDPLVVQHLLLGMNAHINLDLGVVVAGLAGSSSSLAPLAGDFDAINTVLAEIVDRCQEAVTAASPALGLVDQVLGRADEEAAGFSLRLARHGAWEFAGRLHGAARPDRPGLVRARDVSVAEVGRRLLTRAGPADAVQRVLRLTEWRSPSEVIDLLSAVDVS